MEVNKEIETGKRRFEYKKSLKQSGNSFIEKYIRVERYINRPLASLIVRAVFRTPVTPNGLTYFSFILGLASAASFAMGQPHYVLWGGILIQLSSIVDCADGMLARAKNMCSDFGSHLDLFLDRITDFFLIAGIATGFFVAYDDVAMFLLGLLAAGLYLLQINLFYITKSYQGIDTTGETGELRALMLFLMFILALFNRMDIVIYLLLVETSLNTFVRVIHFISLGRTS
jgi:phosphatidylglycerophosphate synthase